MIKKRCWEVDKNLTKNIEGCTLSKLNCKLRAEHFEESKSPHNKIFENKSELIFFLRKHNHLRHIIFWIKKKAV